MPENGQPNKPGPKSGYREQPDPRGQPGEDQTRDGRRVPEEIDPETPEQHQQES